MLLFAEIPFFDAESKRVFNYVINLPVNEERVRVPTKPREFEIYKQLAILLHSRVTSLTDLNI